MNVTQITKLSYETATAYLRMSTGHVPRKWGELYMGEQQAYIEYTSKRIADESPDLPDNENLALTANHNRAYLPPENLAKATDLFAQMIEVVRRVDATQVPKKEGLPSMKDIIEQDEVMNVILTPRLSKIARAINLDEQYFVFQEYIHVLDILTKSGEHKHVLEEHCAKLGQDMLNRLTWWAKNGLITAIVSLPQIQRMPMHDLSTPFLGFVGVVVAPELKTRQIVEDTLLMPTMYGTPQEAKFDRYTSGIPSQPACRHHHESGARIIVRFGDTTKQLDVP